METNYNILENEILRYNYVSFDLFDTLVFRTVDSPTDIFYLVEERYYELYHKRLKGYFKKRIEAECRARQGKSEITIDDIYNEIDIKDATLKTSLKSLEKEIEIQSVVPHKKMVEIVKRCRERNQHIVIITDMYLDSVTIKTILNKIEVPYDNLFLSSETKCTKLTGKMYEYVLNKLNIKSEDIIHIGDDKLKDVVRAREIGIRALQSVICVNANSDNDIVKNHINSLSSTKLQTQVRSENIAFDIGYKVIGPFLFEFCRWVHSIANRESAKRIAFVAREGYLIKKIYDTMYPEETDKSLYLCLNKNLLRFPILCVEPTIENFISTIPSGDLISLDEVLSYFFLNDAQKTSFLCEIESSAQETFKLENLSEDSKFVKIFNRLIELKAGVIKTQYDYLIRYIKNNGLLQGITLLVNNSFNGNGQRLLAKILGLSDISIDNLFIGVQFARSFKCYKYNQNKSLGWLNTVASDELAYEFSKYALPFEHLLFEPKGTAKEFIDNGIKFEERGVEEKNDAILNVVQQYANEFVKDYKENVPISIENYAIKAFMRLFQFPTFREAILIGDLYDYDVKGATKLIDISNLKLANNIKSILAIRKCNKLYWRQGTMTLLNLNSKYIKLYNLIARFNIKRITNKNRKLIHSK